MAGRQVEPPSRARTHAVPPVRSAPHAAALLARRPALRPSPRLARALRVQRRERVPWTMLSRERLTRAWERVQADHGAGAADLRLVGVYGPLAIGAAASVALETDGRLAVALAAPSRGSAVGDLALARLGPAGPLVRSDIPYPAPGRPRGRLR